MRPFKNRSRLAKEIFQEVCFLMIHVSIFPIIENERDQIAKFKFGWLVIGGAIGILGIYIVEGVGQGFQRCKSLIAKRSFRAKMMKSGMKLQTLDDGDSGGDGSLSYHHKGLPKRLQTLSIGGKIIVRNKEAV